MKANNLVEALKLIEAQAKNLNTLSEELNKTISVDVIPNASEKDAELFKNMLKDSNAIINRAKSGESFAKVSVDIEAMMKKYGDINHK